MCVGVFTKCPCVSGILHVNRCNCDVLQTNSVIQFPRNFLGRDPHFAWELRAGLHRSHPPCWRVSGQSRNTSVGVKCDSCDWWYGDAFRLVCTCRLCSWLPDGLSQGEISTSVKILLQRDVWLRSHVCNLVSRSDNVNDEDYQKPLHSVGHVISLKKYIKLFFVTQSYKQTLLLALLFVL